MVRRIVHLFHPDKIILFGSHARGGAGPNSDVDLLIVMPLSGSKREKQVEIRLAARRAVAVARRVRKEVRRVLPRKALRRKKTMTQK